MKIPTNCWASGRTRTADLTRFRVVRSTTELHQPSKSNMVKTTVEKAGLEPATLCLQSRCSNHLSYDPNLRTQQGLNLRPMD